MPKKFVPMTESNYNTALGILDPEPEETIEAEQAPEPIKETPIIKASITPKSKERKTKHLNLLLKPSTYEKLKAAADSVNMSIGEYIEALIEG